MCQPGSSVHGISQGRILVGVAISYSRGSSWLRDWTCISPSSALAGGFFTTEPPGKLFDLYTLFMFGKSHGQRSLVGNTPWGRKESDTTEQLTHIFMFGVFTYVFIYLCAHTYTPTLTCQEHIYVNIFRVSLINCFIAPFEFLLDFLLYVFMKNLFIEVWVIYKKLCILIVYHLISLEICIHPWNHHYNLCCTPVPHSPKFPPCF